MRELQIWRNIETLVLTAKTSGVCNSRSKEEDDEQDCKVEDFHL